MKEGQTDIHDGVIVGEGENNKEWKIVDPGRAVDRWGDPVPPDYKVRNIHAEKIQQLHNPLERAVICRIRNIPLLKTLS